MTKGVLKWIDAGRVGDLADGQAISIPVGRRMIAVARSGAAYFAIEDICTHDGAALTGGAIVFETKIEGDHLWVRAD
jgi:nitrite reductase/ring-hydroxylating ferredoxin subunit